MTYRKQRSKWLLFGIAVGAAILALTVQPSMAAYFVQPDLYWQLEDADPSTAVVDDIAGLTGECAASCPTPSTGVVGQSFAFAAPQEIFFTYDATTNPLDQFLFNGAVGFSIEMWVKRNGTAGIVSDGAAAIGRLRDPGAEAAFWVGLDANGLAACDMWDEDGPRGEDGSKLSGKTFVADNQWHHIVLVRDGANDKLMIYVDGVLDVEKDQSADTYTDGLFTTTADVFIGSLKSFLPYGGEVDGLAIYKDKVLAADVIAQNYANGLNGKDLDEEFPTILAATAADSAAVGSTASLRVIAAGNPMPTYASTDLPTGAAIDAATGIITWLPRDNQTSANIMNITATNAGGAASQELTVTVDALCTANLGALWKLEETDPATSGVVDVTGVNTGTCVGAECPVTGTGKIGNGFVFNEAGDNVQFADNAAFSFDGSVGFSIEMYIKRNGNPTGDEAAIGRFSATSAAWVVGLDAGGRVFADFFDKDGDRTSTRFNGGTSVADDQWHHVVVVRDGVSDMMMIYVDGKLNGSADQSGDTLTDGSFDLSDLDPDPANIPPVRLGQFDPNDPGSTLQFAGELDEVAIYNKPLSATTVAQHAAAGSDLLICNPAAPAFSSVPVTTATEGEAYAYTAVAADADGHTVTYELTTFPTGMTIDASTGAISWTPDNTVTATESVVVQATDQFGATGSQPYDITVTITTPGDNPDPDPTDPTDPTPPATGGGGGGGGCFIGAVNF